MECNIDNGGKYVRLLLGIATVLFSIPVIMLTLTGELESNIGWMVVASMWAGGLFSIYEGWSGWCVVRALGFRTPI